MADEHLEIQSLEMQSPEMQSPEMQSTEIQPINEQFNQFADFIQRIDESRILRIVTSITYDDNSQRFIIQMRNLLRREPEEMEEQHPTALRRSPAARRLYEDNSQRSIIQMRNLLRQESEKIEERYSTALRSPAARRLKELATHYKESFPEFRSSFSKWRPCRQELIQATKTYADKLERNSMLASAFRILTSTADFCGTIMRMDDLKSSWTISMVESASAFGFASVLFEKILSVSLHKKVVSLVQKDQELFQPMKAWFLQTEELDAAIQNFFPYGIDEKLVLEIHRSSSILDECSKLFASVIASNVKNDTTLFTNRDFLDKANIFSESEAGMQWYNKIITKNDPFYLECLKSDWEQEINMRTNFFMENPELYSNSSFILTNAFKNKIIVNGVSFLLAASNILNGAKTDESRRLRKLATEIQKELEAMDKILDIMEPIVRPTTTIGIHMVENHL